MARVKSRVLGFLRILGIAGRTGRVTRKYPYEPPLVTSDFRGKIEFDSEKCIGCGACVLVCPSNALEIMESGGRVVLRYFIGRCIFCWRCIDVCPVEAIRGTRDFELATDNIDDLYEVVLHDTMECSVCGKRYMSVRQKDYVVEKASVTEYYIDMDPECRRNKLLNGLLRRFGGGDGVS